MEDGHDRRFLHQNLLCFPIQLYPLPLVQAALGSLYQAIVTLITPLLPLDITNLRPQEVVRIRIIAPPPQDEEIPGSPGR